MTSPQIQVAVIKSTPVSTILNFLINACIIPLKINRSEKTISFKLRSKQTLIFLLYQSIVYGVTIGFMNIYMAGIKPTMKWLITKYQSSNTIDFISFMCIMIMSSSITYFVLPFTKQLTYIENEVILSPNLHLPNHWRKFVFFSLFYVISLNVYMYMIVQNSILIEYPFWIAGTLINVTFINIFIFISFFVILCLIDEFRRITSLPQNNIVLHTIKCIDLFKTLQKGFGSTFMVTFSFFQIQNVFCTYMIISSLMRMEENIWQNIVLSGCYFTMSAYFMAMLYCITLTSEEAYDALQSLNTPLEKMLVHENDFTKREHIKSTIRKLEKMQPLNGNGYFNVTRETLTSIVSITVTYLIILLQFR